jgi:ribonuclease E
VVAGEAGYREARQFMRLLMPSHVNSVQLYRDSQPAFAKAGVESQLDSMFSNQVTLKSGGYIVINQTEALVAIDVNSGRSTREHNIEDTALRTNLEAADEIARQLRLRDLAGLIVVDFIDMEESRNNRAVERRTKDALKNDRARIQVGRISHFGLLEMSRQRIRTGVLEGSTVVCAHCQGAGVVRSTASIALHVLRVLEDALIKSATHDVTVRTRTPVALYILNQKRANLRDLERRFGVAIVVEADDMLTGANYHAIERGEPAAGLKSEAEPAKSLADDFVAIVEEPGPVEEDSGEIFEATSQGAEEVSPASERGGPSLDEDDVARRWRRRRRRRSGERSFGENPPHDAPQPTDDGLAVVAEIGGDLRAPNGEADAFGRRGPRGEQEHNRRSRRPRGERSRFRHDGEGTRDMGAPSFDSPPPLALEQEFAASEADYSQAPPPGHDAVAAQETTTEPARTSPDEAQVAPAAAAAARESAVEAVVAGSTPTVGSSASPEAPATARPAPEPAPAMDEPPRPRRSGWWQRARASVIGE